MNAFAQTEAFTRLFKICNKHFDGHMPLDVQPNSKRMMYEITDAVNEASTYMTDAFTVSDLHSRRWHRTNLTTTNSPGCLCGLLDLHRLQLTPIFLQLRTFLKENVYSGLLNLGVCSSCG